MNSSYKPINEKAEYDLETVKITDFPKYEKRKGLWLDTYPLKLKDLQLLRDRFLQETGIFCSIVVVKKTPKGPNSFTYNLYVPKKDINLYSKIAKTKT
jgi:hypothetical protein